jgi:hypothetical protein
MDVCVVVSSHATSRCTTDRHSQVGCKLHDSDVTYSKEAITRF